MALKYQYTITIKRLIQSAERTAKMTIKSDGEVEISKPDDKGTIGYLIAKLSMVEKYLPWCKDEKITMIKFEREEEVGV